MNLALFLTLVLNQATPDPVSAPILVGKSTIEAKFDTVTMKLFIYKPKEFRDGPMLMVFHGVLRNAAEYRDHSVNMGDRFGALIVAPHFDEKTFPKEKYQRSGIVNDGKSVPPTERTGEYVNRIAKFMRKRVNRPEMPYALIGHSAGGQFVARLSAFVKTDAVRIVASNPGTHLFPVRDAEFPLGFGALPSELRTEEQLKFYLAQPLTLYLGSKDIERDEYLDVTPESDRQGKTRFERGKNVFTAAKKLAAEKNWPFGWKLVIATGVDHDHEKMFDHPSCAQALEWKSLK